MMSKEYIERNEVIERIRRVYCLDCESMKRYGDACCDSCGIGDALNIIDDQPAADVVEVKQGEWIASYEEFCECSLCKYPVYAAWNKTNFCPNCGAKMDGKRRGK